MFAVSPSSRNLALGDASLIGASTHIELLRRNLGTDVEIEDVFWETDSGTSIGDIPKEKAWLAISSCWRAVAVTRRVLNAYTIPATWP